MNRVDGVLALALVAAAARGQETAPTLIVRGGRLFDADAATARPLGQLWVAGERILGERAHDAVIPAGARVIEADGCTLLPGLFDLHVHVAVSGGAMIGGTLLDPAENLATSAAFGVLHVVDLHNLPEAVFPLRDRSQREPGLARLLAAGAAFTAPHGHGTQMDIEANTATTAAEVGERFAKLLSWKPDVVKGIVEHGGWAMVPPLPTLDEPLLAEIARRTRAAGLPFLVHVWTLDEAKTAVRAGADVLAHGVFLGAVDDELARAMKERGVGYVPTLAVVVGPRRVARGETPYTRERIGGRLHPDLGAQLDDPASISWAARWEEADEGMWLANLKRLFDAGVRIGAGTDAGNPLAPHGPALLYEVALYVEAGLTPAQALRCATLESARLVRRDRDFGSLAPGRIADLLLVRGDPLADVGALWRTERVFKAGREVDLEELRGRNAGRATAAVVWKVGAGLDALVDDFDDGDLSCAWGGEWTATQDSGAPGGRSRAAVAVVEAGDSGHLLVEGALEEGFPYGPFAGVAIQWDPERRRLADLGAARHVALRARGTARDWSLVVERAAVKDFDAFQAAFSVTDEWQELRVPLSALRQTGFGRAVPVDWSDVFGLGLQARARPGATAALGEFELEVDWIRIE